MDGKGLNGESADFQAMGGDLLTVQNVTRRFDENIVLYNVSLSIPDGEIYGIIGRSGCGKTTLLRLLIGFLEPSKGKVMYRGKSLSKCRAAVTHKFGFAAQKSSLYGKLTVRENLRHYGRMYGLSKKQIIERTQSGDVLAEKLSSGMVKRLPTASALIHDPDVLILDEPTADLDPLLRKDILALVKKINEYGTTIVITSHILSEIDALCDRIAILDASKVVKEGSPKKLEASLFTEKIVRVQTDKRKYKELLEALHKKKISLRHYYMEGGTTLCIHTEAPNKLLTTLLDVVPKLKDAIVSTSIARPNLEDVFASVMKRPRKK